MEYPDAPVLCDACRAEPELAGLVLAGMIRDDEKPARCALCGFKITPSGARVPENANSPSAEAEGL